MSAGACSDTGKVAGVSIESLVCPFCPVGYRVPLGWPSIHDILSEAGLTMRAYARANGYVRIEAFAAGEEADEQRLHWQSASLFARRGYTRGPDTCGPWWTPCLFYRELV